MRPRERLNPLLRANRQMPPFVATPCAAAPRLYTTIRLPDTHASRRGLKRDAAYAAGISCHLHSQTLTPSHPHTSAPSPPHTSSRLPRLQSTGRRWNRSGRLAKMEGIF